SASVAGGAIIASASGIAVAPHPVRIDPATGAVQALPNPADPVDLPGTLTEVAATAEDGTALRAWLRLPEGEGPHPLVVFAHGGPWGSWNAWTYRWNPGPFVAAGYAVLLPDPAISTGYGQAMIDRGQHQLGGTPYSDIMALTDVTTAREDIDAERTAFAGGSYGGYMANWVAGHTGDRFRCIVTHASLWDTESMGRTTDNAGWERSMRGQNAQYNPKDFVDGNVVPMLVIHGDKDYRVPIAQGHALWYDLHEFSSTPRDAGGRTRHRYRYVRDDGHWIQGRGNAQVWYETFVGYVDAHVRGEDWQRPATLGGGEDPPAAIVAVGRSVQATLWADDGQEYVRVYILGCMTTSRTPSRPSVVQRAPEGALRAPGGRQAGAFPARRATLAGLGAIVVWSAMVALLRLVSDDFGATLGMALVYSLAAAMLWIVRRPRALRSFPLRYLLVGGALFVTTDV